MAKNLKIPAFTRTIRTNFAGFQDTFFSRFFKFRAYILQNARNYFAEVGLRKLKEAWIMQTRERFKM